MIAFGIIAFTIKKTRDRRLQDTEVPFPWQYNTFGGFFFLDTEVFWCIPQKQII